MSWRSISTVSQGVGSVHVSTGGAAAGMGLRSGGIGVPVVPPPIPVVVVVVVVVPLLVVPLVVCMVEVVVVPLLVVPVDPPPPQAASRTPAVTARPEIRAFTMEPVLQCGGW
jgi:hypothetical protein